MNTIRSVRANIDPNAIKRVPDFFNADNSNILADVWHQGLDKSSWYAYHVQSVCKGVKGGEKLYHLGGVMPDHRGGA